MFQKSLAFVLKFVPLKTILLAGATLILDKKPEIVAQVQDLITQAEMTISGGSAKFAWVKERVIPLLKDKAGVWVDTAIQALVAVMRLKAAAS